MASRTYSPTTIKVLFGACGNQCAEPTCTLPIIVPETPLSDAAVMGQICHIYAFSDNGPRGNPSMTDEERNAPANLILMCGFHHPLVDKQYDDYPASTLIAWKKAHEAKYQQGTAEALKLQSQMQQNAFLRDLSDKEIDSEVERIRKARYLSGFRINDEAVKLASRVEETELVGGSAEHRAKALAWCARFLNTNETRARGLLAKSRELAPTTEAEIAEAFILGTTDRAAGLAKLAPINSPAAKSAALRIVTNHDKEEGALDWVAKAGLTFASFDADGKLYMAMSQLALGRWADVVECAKEISENDITETPALLQVIAAAQLVQAVPDDYRALATSQVPFEAEDFPLADTEAALAARRKAATYYQRLSDVAMTLGVATASNPASDHALWLRLRDPKEHAAALEELRESMRDDAQSLRRVHLAMQFGIKLDLSAIERKIDQSIALSGKATGDQAFARFAMAFAKSTPKEVAEYIAQHRQVLYEHLQRSPIVVTEIEMLARGGLKDAAEKRLEEETAAGLGERERQHLDRVIAEARGADPVTERRKMFEQTGTLTDLMNLVNLLEKQKSWGELCPYAQKLFEATKSANDAFRFGRALERTDQYDRLHAFLLSQPELIAQSSLLKTMLAWSYYREGDFDASKALLDEFEPTRNDPSDRILRVQLAIQSGQWHELVAHTTSEWNSRANREPHELLAAGELAQAVGAPHSRDLIEAAVQGAPADPGILVGAYSHVTKAGSENEEAGRWLTTAAALSGKDGPIKSVSMKELAEQKPDWDKREAKAWEQLNEGSIPVFGAALMLNRSLIDFVLLQALGNLGERDPRKRAVIYSYSGSRPYPTDVKPESIALDLTAIFTLARLNLLDTVLATYSPVTIPHTTLGWLFTERQRATFHQPSRIRDAHDLKRLTASGDLQVYRTQLGPDAPLVKEVGLGLAGLLLAVEEKTKADSATPRMVVRSNPVHRIGSLLEEEADLSPYSAVLCSCHAVIEKLRARGCLTTAEEERALAYLKLHERRWPTESAIPDGAELYLDDLSVSYLKTVSVLGKLKLAGLTAYITESEDDDANRLIAFESLSAKQLEVIETVRKSLADGIKSGRVKAVRSTVPDEEEDAKPLKMHPTVAVLTVNQDVDAFVVDDRYVNRYLHMDTESGRHTPIWSTLDLLGDLHARDLISTSDLYLHRTTLRQSGYQLVPVTLPELLHHLKNARLVGDNVQETAELRAIRESLLKARMSKVVQIPLEMPWLFLSMRSLIQAVKEMWLLKADHKEAMAYAEWLLNLVDIRGWAPSAQSGNERGFAVFSYAAHVQSLAAPPDGATQEVKDAYHDWIDKRLVNDVRDTNPEAFEWMVLRAREIIKQSADEAADRMGA